MARALVARGRPGARHESFLRHARFRWAWVALLLSLAAGGLYLLDTPVPRPNGGSAYGYALGTLATGLILWLTALGVRKRAIGTGRYSLKAWTSAHVYLGLALAVIGTLHSGFEFGWDVHTLAYALMLLVIVSGLVGVCAYALIPAQLSANRGAATQPQMLASLADLDRQLDAAAQPVGRAYSEIVRLSLTDRNIGGRFAARLSGWHPRCGTAAARAALAAATGPDGDDDRLAGIAALLDRKAAALAQARRHAQLKALLELWLYVHVPATFALLAALAAHIVSVFFYW